MEASGGAGGSEAEKECIRPRKLKHHAPKLNTAAIGRSASSPTPVSNRTARRSNRSDASFSATARADGKSKSRSRSTAAQQQTAVAMSPAALRQYTASAGRSPPTPSSVQSPPSSSSAAARSPSTSPMHFHQRSLPNFHGLDGTQEQPFPWELRVRLEQRSSAAPTFRQPITRTWKPVPVKPGQPKEINRPIVYSDTIERILSLELDPIAREIKRKTLQDAEAKREERIIAYESGHKEASSKEQADAAEKAAAKRAKAANAGAQRATSEKNMKAIIEAGKRAAEEAASSPFKSIEQLETLKLQKEAEKTDVLARLEVFTARKAESLKRQLGEAILERAISTNKLMEEWDRNGDGSLSKIEFKQAIRISLSLTASNEEIDRLFDTFDEDGGGSVSLAELRPAIRQIHQYCRGQRSLEKATYNRKLFCEAQLKALNECIATMTKQNTVQEQLVAFRAEKAIEVTVGIVVKLIKQKLAHGSSLGQIAEDFGGSSVVQPGFIDREGFVKSCLMMKTMDELPLEGTNNEAKDRLERAFDMLTSESNSNSADESSEKGIEIKAAIEVLQRIASTQDQKEGQMAKEEAALSKKAHHLQVAYAEQAARKDKEYELSKSSITEEIEM